MELMIFAGGRWRRVCSSTGRVAGWRRRRAKVVCNRRGVLAELPLIPALTSVIKGPAVPQKRKEFPFFPNHQTILNQKDACVQTNIDSIQDLIVAKPIFESNFKSSQRKPKAQQMKENQRFRSFRSVSTEILEERLDINETDNWRNEGTQKLVPQIMKTQHWSQLNDIETQPKPQFNDKEIQRPGRVEKVFSSAKTSSTRYDTQTETKYDTQSQTSSEKNNCKELIIDEQDVLLLRKYIESHKTSIDLYRFDTDDGYKTLVFFSINPLVKIERCARISKMLRDHDSHITVHFARKLGLRSVDESPEKVEKKPRGAKIIAQLKMTRDSLDREKKMKETNIKKHKNCTENDPLEKHRNAKVIEELQASITAADSDNPKVKKRKYKHTNIKQERNADSKENNRLTRYREAKLSSYINMDSNTDSEDVKEKWSKRKEEQRKLHHKNREYRRWREKRNKNKITGSNDLSTESISSDTDDEDIRFVKITRASEKIGKLTAPIVIDSENDEGDKVIKHYADVHEPHDKAKNRIDRHNKEENSSNSEVILNKKRKENTVENLNKNNDHTESDEVVKSFKSPQLREKLIRNIGNSNNSGNSQQISDDKTSKNSKNKGNKFFISKNTKTQEKFNSFKPFPQPKRSSVPPGREYSMMEDQAIIAWLSISSQRERAVKGNSIWKELEEVYPNLTTQKRSWHSLRNRFLRYILPRLGELALPDEQAQRLRAHAAMGQLKPTKIKSRRNSAFHQPPVKSAWALVRDTQTRKQRNSSDSTEEQSPVLRVLRSSGPRSPTKATNLGSPKSKTAKHAPSRIKSGSRPRSATKSTNHGTNRAPYPKNPASRSRSMTKSPIKPGSRSRSLTQSENPNTKISQFKSTNRKRSSPVVPTNQRLSPSILTYLRTPSKSNLLGESTNRALPQSKTTNSVHSARKLHQSNSPQSWTTYSELTHRFTLRDHSTPHQSSSTSKQHKRRLYNPQRLPSSNNSSAS